LAVPAVVVAPPPAAAAAVAVADVASGLDTDDTECYSGEDEGEKQKEEEE